MIRIILGLALAISVGVAGQEDQSSGPPSGAAGKDALQRDLEHEIMAPCCYGSPVGDHDSEAARQVKDRITRLLAEGKTKAEIIDLFVATYGEQILARPRARGFNLLAYLMPPAILLAGGLLLVYFISRFRTPMAPKAPAASNSDSARLLEKIEREMRELDI